MTRHTPHADATRHAPHAHGGGDICPNHTRMGGGGPKMMLKKTSRGGYPIYVYITDI